MEMVQIIHPTVSDYLSVVRGMASQYGCKSWLDLLDRKIKMNEDDQDKFSFIEKAVGDKLVLQEFEQILLEVDEVTNDPPEDQNVGCTASTEPGSIPGWRYCVARDSIYDSTVSPAGSVRPLSERDNLQGSNFYPLATPTSKAAR